MSDTESDIILLGNNPEKVLSFLWTKQDSSKKNHAETQTRKLGLIMEGGGIRSVISTGILVALHKLGLTTIFDFIYGSSAGAASGAYFLSQQIPYAASLYFEELNTNKFIKLLRIPPFLDIDYLMKVVETKKILDVEAVKASPTRLYQIAVNVHTGEFCFFSNHDKNTDFFKVLKASCAIPFFYNKPVEIAGAYYLDNAFLGYLPILRAIEDGCTDILILLNQKIDRPLQRHLLRVARALYLRKYGKPYTSLYQAHEHLFTQSKKLMTGEDPRTAHTNIAVFAPTNHLLDHHTKSTKKIKSAYQRSYQYGLETILRFKPQD